MTKHTPGPWSVGSTKPYFGPNKVIAGPFDILLTVPSCGEEPETWEANARLIAAAPELLEALREMVADLISHATLGLNEREVAMLKRAEAAIAKAEG